ncbi:MAG TPA: hypothetical protein VJ901_06445 [Thermoanaerobaculia bacterium]|nr:hypothetical protein [Thermoanaerobaculia bacterium]
MNACVRVSLVFALIVCGLGAAAEEPAIVKPVFGLTYTLGAVPNSGGWVAARIPITIEKDAKKIIAIELTNVTTTTPPVSSWAQCVRAGFSQLPGTGLAILITSTCAKLAPSVYEVNVAVTSEKQVQRLIFQLTRPAGELRPLATQVVNRTDSLFSTETAPKELIVVETSARTPLTGVSASRIENLAIGTDSIGGDVHFGPANADERGVARLPLTLSGRFPKGVAKTTVMIGANELATPVYVAYEIHTRFHSWLLFLAIFIGLALGYATRTLLVRFVESRTAYITALDLREKIGTEKTSHPDAAFAAAVDPLLVQLNDAIAKRPADLPAVVKDIGDKFTAASSALQERIKTARQAFETSASLPSPDGFPPAIAEVLKKAQQAIDDARALVDSNPAEAQKALAQATTQLQRDLDDSAGTWRANVLAALDNAIQNPLPAKFDEPFKPAISALKTALDQLPLGQSKDAATVLSAIYKVQFDLRHNLVERVLVPIEDYAQSVIKVLKNKGEPVATSEGALQAYITAEGIARLAQLDALLGALAADIKAAADKNGVNVAADLAAGRYLEAARTALKMPPNAVIGGAHEVFPASLKTIGEALIAPPLQLMQKTFPHLSFTLPSMETMARARSLWEIGAAKFASFVMSAIGIAFAGLLVLLPTFDGTWRGLLTALFWGYAGDISVDALTAAAKKYRT